MAGLNLDVDYIGGLIKEVVEQELISRMHSDVPLKVWCKSSCEIVTEADIAAGQVLESVLTKVLPGSLCLNEENVMQFQTAHYLGSEAGLVWIIDPLDGTSQFAQGKTDWGTIVSLVSAGEVVMAWIVVPFKDWLVAAELGSGCKVNGQTVRINSQSSEIPKGAVLALGDYNPIDRSEVEWACRHYKRIRGTLSCAVDYAELCLGYQSIAIFGRTRPWDHAAGVFLHKEAGGVHLCFGSTKYAVSNWHSGLLLGPDLETVNTLAWNIQVFRPS